MTRPRFQPPSPGARRKRYIAFQSTFSFDAADDDSGTTSEDEDLYVYDTVTDSYLLISSTLKGELSGFDMNDDGDRFVFSTEEAINANDANGFRDVYVADVDLETFTVTSRQRVSEAEGGFELTNGESYAPTISPDGEKVAFLTRSETIVNFREDFFPDANDGLFNELLFIVDLPDGELLTPPTAVAVGPSREELSTHLSFTDDGFFYRPLTSPVDCQCSAGIIEAGTGQALADIDVDSVVIDRTTTLRSSIDFDGDLDIFEIKPTSSGGNYFVSIEAAGAGVGSLSDPSVRVLESDGDVARGASGVGFAEDDNGGLGSDAFTGFQLTNNGSRFIEVSSADGSLGSYVLRVGTSVSVLDDPLPAVDDFIF